MAALDLSLAMVSLPPAATALLIGGLSREARAVGDGRIC
ncbi:MAG: hypothetical protein ACJA2W_003338, partial [Planctomycetota bacterium]